MNREIAAFKRISNILTEKLFGDSSFKIRHGKFYITISIDYSLHRKVNMSNNILL